MSKKYANRKSFLSKGMAVVVLAALVVWVVMPSAAAAKTTHQSGDQALTEVAVLGVPTTLSPANGEETQQRKPVITGVTENNTKVAMYIDGTYNGHATVKNDPSGTANFSYTPFLDLGYGSHQIQARAETDQGRSDLSKSVTIEVERPFVAPTLFEPVVNEKTTPDQPFIVGVALDNSLVKVYIDGKLDGEMMTENDDSGTGHFSYKPFLPLDPNKDHLVYAVAHDKDGKESPYSNAVGFRVTANKPIVAAVPETSEVSVEEAVEEITKEEAIEEEIQEEEVVPEPEETEEVIEETEENPIASVDENLSIEEEGQVLGEVEEATEENPIASADETTEEAAEEETTEGEDTEESEDVTEEEGEEATNEDDEEEATDDEDEESNTSIIIWVVILVIVIILIVLSLRGGSDEGQTKGPENKEKSGDKNSKNEPSKEGQDQNKGDSGNMPSPPPSSSSY